MTDKWISARIELRDGLIELTAETDIGSAENIGERRTMTMTEVERLNTAPADLLVSSFRDERTREIARAFVRELRRFCRECP